MARARGSILIWVAFVLFILAAIFLFFVHAIPSYVDWGLIALGLALWALDDVWGPDGRLGGRL